MNPYRRCYLASPYTDPNPQLRETRCLSFLEFWATEICVLTLPGWKESVGVAAEIDFALKLGLPAFLRDAHGNMEPYHA